MCKVLYGSVAGVLTSLLAANTTLAQTDAAAEPSSASPSGLEELVVTAQRRSESLQRVPISVTAITAQALEKSGVASTTDLAMATPGLVMTNQKGGLTPYLRGVGTPSGGVGEESSIATYVDGVYIGSQASSIFSLNSIERIEVLKGPQGTLFGRNATGGLIHVITKDPSHTTEVAGSLGYGNYQTSTANLYATTGLTDSLAADIALFATEQGEGWGRNLVSGEDVNRRDEYAARTKFLFTPTDKLTLTLDADYMDRQSDLGTARQVIPGYAGFGGTTFRGTIYDTNSDVPFDMDLTSYGTGLRASYEFDFATLTSTTAYRRVNNHNRFDQDAGPLRVVDAPIYEKTKTFQQEFLLVGNAGKLDWTVGGFYFSKVGGNYPLGLHSSVTLSNNFDRFSEQEVESFAGFGQGTYRVTNTTRITAGVRYTTETRDLDARDIATAGNVTGGAAVPVGTVLRSRNESSDPTAHKKFEKPTWRLAIDQDLGENVLVYASASRGFKSGTFNLTNPYQASVHPEILDAYEVGIKSEFWNRQLRLNLSGFYYDYQDIQLTRAESGTTVILNAAAAEIQGVDLEASLALPVDTGSLTVNASATFLDGSYSEFPNAPFSYQNPSVCTPGGATPGMTLPGVPLQGGQRVCPGNATGHETIRSPRWTTNVSVDYVIPLDSVTLGANVAYYYNDGFFWDPDNLIAQPSYDLVNASAYVAFDDDRWRIGIYGKNLTDSEYYTYVSSGTLGALAGPGNPRTYGITMGFRFGD